MSTVLKKKKIYIYIYIRTHEVCHLTEKEEKKNLMPSSRIVLEIPELMLYAGKIMSYVWLELPFYSAGQREFNCNSSNQD